MNELGHVYHKSEIFSFYAHLASISPYLIIIELDGEVLNVLFDKIIRN